MKKIFIGMLFIFLDFNFDTGSGRIGFIPDFVGYIFMIYGLGELSDKSSYFPKAKPFAVVMAVYTAVLYIVDLLGSTFNNTVLSFVLGLASTILSLYISYSIVMGIREMETTYSRQLNGDNLFLTWKVLAVFSIASYMLVLIPALGLISIIAGFVVSIIFLVSFNTSKNLYYSKIG